MTNIDFDFIQNMILPYVKHPSQYLGNEINIIKKNPEQIKARIVLAFPDLYPIGMSYLGFQILYHIFNKNKEISCERIYITDEDMSAQLRKYDIPLYSLETKTPLESFDVIGFTLPFEMNYTGILEILNLAKIPLFSKDRSPNHPIIIAGGLGAYNPAPLENFIDAFVIGDGEEIASTINEILLNYSSRDKRIEALAKIEGIYVPVLHDNSNKIQALRVNELKPSYYPDYPIVPLIETVHDRLAIEIMRGCTRGCRFCNAGMMYRPKRQLHPSDIILQAINGIANSGWEEISLFSLSSSDYDALEPLAVQLNEIFRPKGVSISLPSLRPDAITFNLARTLATVRKSGITLAPEAGTERLRNIINKPIKDDELLASIAQCIEGGWSIIKLYFMVGLPGEQQEDIDGIINLVKQVSGLSRKSQKRMQINITLSPFVPKPHTPFQWAAQKDIQYLHDAQIYIKRNLSGSQYKISGHEPKISQIEAVLSRGDRKIGQVIYKAWQLGSHLDGWTEHFDLNRWERAFAETDVDINHYLGEFKEDTIFPWDFIDSGVKKNFLLREWKNAKEQKVTDDCHTNSCSFCGFDPKSCPSLKRIESLPMPEISSKPIVKMIISENNVHIYRLEYKKLNMMRFLGHLRSNETLLRAFRRADLPLYYTIGFNKHPKIEYGPPLPLGMSSFSEIIDISTIEPLVDNVLNILNKQMPEGLEFTNLLKLTSKKEALNLTANNSIYHTKLPDNVDKKQLLVSISNLLLQKDWETARPGSELKDRRFLLLDIKLDELNNIIETQIIQTQTINLRLVEVLRHILSIRNLKQQH